MKTLKPSTHLLLFIAFYLGLGFTANATQPELKDSITAAYQKALKLSENQQYPEALKLVEENLNKSFELNDSALIARGYIEKAEINFFMYNLKQAEEDALLSEKYCRGTADSLICLKIHGVQAGIHSRQGRYSEALSEYTKALKLAKGAGLDENYYGLLFNMSTPLTETGDYHKSLSSLISCKEYFQDKQKHWRVATINNNLGLLYLERFEQPEPALEYFQEAIAIDEQNPLSLNLARDYGNIALVFVETRQFDSANYYLDKAIDIRLSKDDQGGLAHAYHTKANVYMHAGDFENARKYFTNSKRIAEQNEIAEGQYYTNLGLGLVADSLGQLSTAEAYYHKAHDFANQSLNEQFLRSSAEHLYRFYKRQGQPDKALAFFELAVSYRDSLMAARQEKDLMNLKTRYETDLTEAENKFLRSERYQNKIISQRDEAIQSYSYGIIGVLFLAVISLVLAYRARKKALKLAHRQRQDLKEVNHKLRQQTRELNESNAAKDRLFSIISHDLRGPIASIDSALEIMHSEDLGAEEKNDLTKDLKQETTNTLKVLDELLAWARLQQNDTSEKTNFEMESVAREVLALYEPMARHKNLRLELNASVDSSWVFADPNQIRTVLRNLVSNAIKFSPMHGLVILAIQNVNGNLKISVTDQGKGISPSEIAKVKDPKLFYSSQGTAGERGTGIGLMLSFDFVKKNGGELHLESAMPRGTWAYFYLLPSEPPKSRKSA